MESKPKRGRGRPRTIVDSAQRKKQRDEHYRSNHREAEELRLRGRERKRVTVSDETMDKLLELQTKFSFRSPNEVISMLIQVFEENENCAILKQQSYQNQSVKREVPQPKVEQIIPRKRRGRPPKNRPVELDLRTSTVPTTIRMNKVTKVIPVYPATTMNNTNNKTIRFVHVPSAAPINNVANTRLVYSNSNNAFPGQITNSISSVGNTGLMNSNLRTVAKSGARTITIVRRAVENDDVSVVGSQAGRLRNDSSGGSVTNIAPNVVESLEDDPSTLSPGVLSARLAFSRALQNSYKALISQDQEESLARDNDSSLHDVSQGSESDIAYSVEDYPSSTNDIAYPVEGYPSSIAYPVEDYPSSTDDIDCPVEDYPSSTNENDSSAYMEDAYGVEASLSSLQDDSSFQEEMEDQETEDRPSGKLVELHLNLSEAEDYPGEQSAIDSVKTELKEQDHSKQSVIQGPSLQIGKPRVPDPKRRSRLDQIAGGLLNKLKRKADEELADS